MKTLYGFTFIQLHSCTVDELTDFMAVYSANQVREAIQPILSEEKANTEKFLSVYAKRLSIAFHNILGDRAFIHMRKVYDTEEKFDEAADLIESMGMISQGIMAKVFEDLIKDEG
jgi:hypothetical protein